MATLNGTFEDSNGNVILNTPHSYAYIESGTTATKAYSKGDLMVFKNQLCQATTDISTGTTLSIGYNVSTTTVANQLSNINVYVGTDKKIHFTDHAGADSVLPFNAAKGLAVLTTVHNYVNQSLIDPENDTYLGNGYGHEFGFLRFPSSRYPNRVRVNFTKNTSYGSDAYVATITFENAGYYLHGSVLKRWHYQEAGSTADRIVNTTSSALLLAFYTDLSNPVGE